MDLTGHAVLGPLLTAQAGVLHADQYRGILTPAQVRAQVRADRWQRAGRGVVVTSNGALTNLQRIWVALAAAPARSAVSGPTAAALDGLDSAVDEVHITIRAASGGRSGRRRPSTGPGSSATRTCTPCGSRAEPGSREASSTGRRGRTSPTERAVRAIVLHAVQRRLVTPDQLRAALARRAHCRHRALIEESIEDARGGMESVPERDFDEVVRRTGLPRPARQRVRYRPSGRAFLDADWPDHGFSAEVEGAHHFLADQREEDLARLNDLVIGGARVLLFSSFAVRRRKDVVASALVRMARASGWAGTASS